MRWIAVYVSLALLRVMDMPKKILLITPPFTQLNTPYPATPYLKGFLRLHGYEVFQADLGIKLINTLFSRKGFEKLFAVIEKDRRNISANSVRILKNEQYYLQTIESVMNFLQYRDNTLARVLCDEHFLPRASRFDQLPDLEWSFGSAGVNDKARFLATLYIEDIGDLIQDAISPYFGFSRYAEKLGMSAHSFSPIKKALDEPENLIDVWLLESLKKLLEDQQADIVGITIPFPGNLYSALKCGRFIKKNFPQIKVIAGGGFANTELRELSDPAVFEYLDFITLDDGERPFLNIVKCLAGEITQDRLVRTFVRAGNAVVYMHDEKEKDFAHAEIGCPDYSDLELESYLSLIEMANPMHRLWSEGRWNKLTVAHGCYWHKCSFCDTTLDYIKRYDSAPAPLLVDRIEQVIAQTGQTGFHFVDEAAPPGMLKELALELLRRQVAISWWANIRFEQAFTEDLCRLLAASGCIAVTGGLETASDRLLKLMNKGVTIRQAAQVCRNFTDAGIMVHAYLMYGFPTQTEQETVDSLEIVRQFFGNGLIQSAFWHQFTATVHSDVGQHPEKYKCRVIQPPAGGFAKNDLVHEDFAGCELHRYAQGLKKAVYNYMHGIGIEFPVKNWFDFKIPPLSVKRNYLEHAVSGESRSDKDRLKDWIVWMGNKGPSVSEEFAGKGKTKLVFHTKTEKFTLTTNRETGEWLNGVFERFLLQNQELLSLEDLKKDYVKKLSASFETFLASREWKTLREKGLLLI